MPITSPVSASATGPQPAPLPRRWHRLPLAALRWLAALLAASLLLGLGAWWFLLSQIVPKIDQWREPLAQQASKTLGVTVQIARLSGRNEGWRPELTLDDVRLIDTNGSVALRLPRVTARLSAATLWPSSIWRKEVHVDRLVLAQPQLVLRRDVQGRLHVAGLVFDPTQRQGDASPALDWLLDQELIQIVGGSVTWVDELRNARPLALQAVDLSLHNRMGLAERLHEWRLDATPPAAFGQRFAIIATLQQPLLARAPRSSDTASSQPGPWARWLGQITRASDWQSWSGQISMNLPHVDVQSLKEHANLPFEVQGGQGRLGLTLTVHHGQPEDLSLNADVQAVSVRLGQGLQPLAFRKVTGTITARHEPTQTTLAWQGLSFVTDDGLVWPASQARLQWQQLPSPRMAQPTQTASGGASGATATGLLPDLQGDVWRRTTEGRFETDRLDVALLARLADRLPLGDQLRQQLARLGPVGLGQDLTLSWQGPADAPTHYQAQGRLSGLSWLAAPEHPGLSGATVQFKASEQGGEATLAIDKGWAEFPGAFDEPRIPMDTLKADVSWKLSPAPQAGQAPNVELNIKQASFANADTQGELSATWRMASGAAKRAAPTSASGPAVAAPAVDQSLGELDLKGQLSRAQANRVWRYLPSIIAVQARHYVRDAVRSGNASKVDFEVKGPLAHFPFKDNQHGHFRIEVQTENVSLDYVPGYRAPASTVAPAPGTVQVSAPYWPAFTALNGTLIFEGQGMRVVNASAKLGELGSGTFSLQQINGQIADLDAPDPVLTIAGEGSGPLNDLLRFVSVSPVGRWTGQMLDAAQGQGQGHLAIDLNLPLNRVEAASVKGQVSLGDKDQAHLRLGPSVPLMQNARGQVQFTQDGIKASARARVWGQELSIQGTRDAQGVPRFTAAGLVTAEGLRGASEWPALAKLARHMSGQTPVQVTVALNRSKPAGAAANAPFVARPELQVSTSLQGMALNLPAPLTKEAQAIWPLKVVHRSDDAEGQTDALQLELSGPVQVRTDYRRDLKGPTPRVLRGLLSLSQGSNTAPPPLPPSGTIARIALPSLDLDTWQPLISELSKPAVATPPTLSAAPAATSRAGGSAQGVDSLEDYLPDTLSLKAGALSWRQRTLRDVSITLAHPGPNIWRAQVDAQQLAGQIEMRPEGGTGSTGSRVVARLSRLSVPATDAEAFEAQAAQQMLSTEAASVPALDIVIDQFEWRGLPLGKLEVEAMNRINTNPGGPPLPEWRLTKFRLSNADAQLNATGNWAAMGAQQLAALPQRKGNRPPHRAAFSFSLDLNHFGGLLTRMGLPQTLKGGKGKVAGQISWLGSPLEPDPPTMNGEFNVAVSEGQFLKAEPGVAKLLGVLSLQSLPRRLVLDFRDVFQQGFAFDRIDGDVKIVQGVAATRNLRMRGVQAVVLMEGQANLADETQNLRVFVVPEINAGTASLAYAAINPAVGLGTFIAQVLLRKTVVEASTREFTITGSWADPQVEKVQRSTVPAAAGDEASAPASATASGAAANVPGR